MRILLLTQSLPRPLTNGYNLRIEHYVRRLAERHEVHLVSRDVGELPPDAEQLFASVTIVPLRHAPSASNPLQRLRWAFSVDRVVDRDPAVHEAVRAVADRVRPDVVWISGWFMLVYAETVADIPILGDVIDEGAEEARVVHSRAVGLRDKLVTRKRWHMARAFERNFFPKAKLICLVSEADREFVQRDVPGLKLRVVHNGVDPDHFHPLGEPPLHPSLVFEGNMVHVPNAEGVVHFWRTAWPQVREAFPEVSLTICGRDPLPEVQALDREDGIEVTGFVDDVRPYVDRASVFISPLIGGAGIKNKVLQAWAMAKAVIATPLSSGGLDCRPGENIVIAEPGADFGRAVIEVLSDDALRRRLGEGGRQTVLERYSWDAKTLELEACLEEAASS